MKMGILDKVKKAAPAQQTTTQTAAPAKAQQFRFMGRLNKTELQKEYVQLKSQESKGTHVLKVLKVNAGNLPEHKGGDEFFAASFEVVESNTLKPGTERSWMAVEGKFDYYEKAIKAFLAPLLGLDPQEDKDEIESTDWDAVAAEAIGEDNPLAGRLIIAEVIDDPKGGVNEKTNQRYVRVKFMPLPAEEQAA